MDKKIIRLFLIFLFLAHTSIALAFEITFENKPEFGLPDDAREQDCQDVMSLGSLNKIIQKDSITSIKIRYFDDISMDKKQVERLIDGLFEENRTQVYCYPAWANLLMEPTIEGVVYYRNFKKGAILIWDFQACIKNSNGQWLFILFQRDIKEQIVKKREE
jgi:hypothetical protein